MEKVIINSYEDFEKLVGQQIGVSEYVELSQERINLFADSTLDHQWIHVDTERAKTESPFKSTIAHGYLTLSMLPHLWNQIIEVNNLKMMINYGMDKMKFGQAVLSGQRIRLVASLHSLANLRGVAKAEIKFAIEIEGEKKKALEGILLQLMMRKMICPQCKVGAFFILNSSGERLPVYVSREGEIVPKDPAASLEGYDLTEVYCLCCSWHGSPKRLLKY